MAVKRWLYRGGRPNRLTKIINRGWAIFHSSGIMPESYVTLDLVGRKSGKIVSFPLAMIFMNGDRYLVSMLGSKSNWVQNVRAAGGKARLAHGICEQVLLEPLTPVPGHTGTGPHRKAGAGKILAQGGVPLRGTFLAAEESTHQVLGCTLVFCRILYSTRGEL